MTPITLELQNNLKSMMAQWWIMYNEVIDIANAYWKSDASTWLAAKNDSDPVTVNTKLKKSQLINGITFMGAIQNFFGNSPVTQADYLATINAIKYGNTTGAVDVPPSVEDIGMRILNVCNNCLTLLQQSKTQESSYNANGIATAYASMPDYSVVFGADMTRSNMVSAIVLLQQWQRMLSNLPVTTGDYATTLSQFFRLN